MEKLEIKGLKKTAGATKDIRPGYKGLIIYDIYEQSVRYEGTWRDNYFDIFELKDSERPYWISKPLTMRNITKIIAKDFDYDTYTTMSLEDDGIFIVDF